MQKNEAVPIMVSWLVVYTDKSDNKIKIESVSLVKIDFKGSICAMASSVLEAELKHKW